MKPENRKKAIQMDNYKCRDCLKPVHTKSNNGDGVHHIIYKSESVNDNLWNLITLCFECHRKAHDGIYEKDGERITGRDYMIALLEDLSLMEGFRWQDALNILRKKSNEVSS